MPVESELLFGVFSYGRQDEKYPKAESGIKLFPAHKHKSNYSAALANTLSD